MKHCGNHNHNALKPPTRNPIVKLVYDAPPIAMTNSSSSSSAQRPAFDRDSTGKERDETGLDYFGARYNSGAQGRFMVPDPSSDGIAPLDPQSWNKYSYVRNRPTGFVDIGGKWATGIHVTITKYALQDYVSAKELEILINQQNDMDKNHNKDWEQYKHAMSNGKASPPQTSGEALQKMSEFIGEEFAQAKAGDTMLHLGNAIHTLQDTTSPVHMTSGGEPIAWNGYWSKTSAPHYLGENSPSDSWGGIGNAIRESMAALMSVDPEKAAKKGLTKESFNSEANKQIERFINSFGGFGSDKEREEARLCALSGGYGAACVQ